MMSSRKSNRLAKPKPGEDETPIDPVVTDLTAGTPSDDVAPVATSTPNGDKETVSSGSKAKSKEKTSSKVTVEDSIDDRETSASWDVTIDDEDSSPGPVTPVEGSKTKTQGGLKRAIPDSDSESEYAKKKVKAAKRESKAVRGMEAAKPRVYDEDPKIHDLIVSLFKHSDSAKQMYALRKLPNDGEWAKVDEEWRLCPKGSRDAYRVWLVGNVENFAFIDAYSEPERKVWITLSPLSTRDSACLQKLAEKHCPGSRTFDTVKAQKWQSQKGDAKGTMFTAYYEGTNILNGLNKKRLDITDLKRRELVVLDAYVSRYGTYNSASTTPHRSPARAKVGNSSGTWTFQLRLHKLYRLKAGESKTVASDSDANEDEDGGMTDSD